MSDFGFSDPDIPADNFLAVRISTTPATGSLTLTGVGRSTAGNVRLGHRYPSGRLLFNAPATTGNVFFTFQVQDDGGAGGGVDLDQRPTP